MKRKIEYINGFEVRHSNKKCKNCKRETSWSKLTIAFRKNESEEFKTICMECLLNSYLTNK